MVTWYCWGSKMVTSTFTFRTWELERWVSLDRWWILDRMQPLPLCRLTQKYAVVCPHCKTDFLYIGFDRQATAWHLCGPLVYATRQEAELSAAAMLMVIDAYR